MFIPVPFLVSLGLLIIILAALAASRPPRQNDLMRPPPMRPSSPVPLDAATLAEVKALMESGQMIDAIKLVRNRTGLGLKEAKDLVDTL